MDLPQQAGLRFPREAQRPGPDQQDDLLLLYRHPAHKVVERPVGPKPVTLLHYGISHFLFETRQQYKSQIDHGSLNGVEHFAVVHAGQLNLCPAAPRFVHVHPRTVESPEIIHHRHHKLKRVVGFQVEALITFNRIGSRVCL